MQILSMSNSDVNIEGDTKLPPELVMADILGVSRPTIREALAKLIQEGRVYRIHGKGSFLRARLSTLKLDISKLFSVTNAIKCVDSNPHTVLKYKRIVPACKDIAKKLGILEGELCIEMNKIRYADENIAVYNKNIFRFDVLSGASDEELSGSLFEYFNKNKIPISHARSKVRPAILTRAELPELQNEIELFLLLDEIYFSDDSKVIGVTHDYYASSIFTFEIIRTI